MPITANDRFDAAATKHHDLLSGLLDTVKALVANVTDLKSKLAAAETELEQLKSAGDSDIDKTAAYLETFNGAVQDAIDTAKAVIDPQPSVADAAQAAVAVAVLQPGPTSAQ